MEPLNSVQSFDSGYSVPCQDTGGRCSRESTDTKTTCRTTQKSTGRRWYVVTTVGQAIVLLLAAHKLIDLNPWQQIELFAVLIGLILLGIGHYGWYREQDQQSDLVSMSLLFVAILASVPLAIAAWIDRGHNVFYPVNEFGFLFISVALLATGILFQLKSTTSTQIHHHGRQCDDISLFCDAVAVHPLGTTQCRCSGHYHRRRFHLRFRIDPRFLPRSIVGSSRSHQIARRCLSRFQLALDFAEFIGSVGTNLSCHFEWNFSPIGCIFGVWVHRISSGQDSANAVNLQQILRVYALKPHRLLVFMVFCSIDAPLPVMQNFPTAFARRA